MVVVRKLRFFISILIFVTFILPQGWVSGNSDELPDKANVSGITGRAQKYNLSCESRSAVDLAIFWGVRLSETGFLNSLPRSDDPEVGFVGNPNDYWGYTPPQSYGVHAQPVAESLRNFGLRAEAHKGLTWDQLRGEIAAGRPVIVWVIGKMWPGKPLDYQSKSGTTTVARFEHSMLLVGYDPTKVTVIDPSHGKRQTYTLKEFKRSWKVLGNMAVTVAGELDPEEDVIAQATEMESIMPPLDGFKPVFLPEQKVNQQQDPVPGPVTSSMQIVPITYKVKNGDTLPELASRFGLNWKHLAGKNGIKEPYLIFANQVLILGE